MYILGVCFYFSKNIAVYFWLFKIFFYSSLENKNKQENSKKIKPKNTIMNFKRVKTKSNWEKVELVHINK